MYKKTPPGFKYFDGSFRKKSSRSVVNKIILARSIVSRPALLAIKEPFANMDLEERTRLSKLLTTMQTNCTLIAISNDPILASHCDRVLVMENGKIVADDSFDKISKDQKLNKIFKNTTLKLPKTLKENMLNISDNTVKDDIRLEDFSSYNKISLSRANVFFKRWLIITFIILLIILFFPGHKTSSPKEL
ncbi:MAG: hypothetical protein R2769_01320 [Saprospiraceae bacterium]